MNFTFPQTIKTFPELESIAYDLELMMEIKSVIGLSKKLGKKLCLEYDTTFGLSGYYVSILTAIHPLLINKNNVHPPIAISYYYHEKKYEVTHEAFWVHFVQFIGDLIEHTFVVTDCEDGIRIAIKNATKNFNIKVIRCWKHLNKAIEAWIRRHKGNEYDVAFYVSSVRELLLQETKELFESELKLKKYTPRYRRAR